MRKLLCYLLITSLLLSCCVSNVKAIEAETSLADEETVETTVVELEENQFVEDISVTFVVNTKWDTGYTAEISIANEGTETIHNWMLEFSLPDSITNIWNGEVFSHEDGIYRIKNATWNQDIKVGETITIGFNADYETESHEPSAYKILGVKKVVDNTDYEVECVATDVWDSGYILQVSITNKSDKTLEHWGLHFALGYEINNIWNAEIESGEGGKYTLHSTASNANIKPQESIVFGMEIAKTAEDVLYPQDIVVDEVVFEENTEDNEADDTEDNAEEENEEDYIDALYEYYGIDKNIEDNDKDGLADILEMTTLGLDPTMVDTDEDGVEDKNEDYDEDGLENLVEIQNDSDPVYGDSDEDGLLDGKEYYDYKTNMLKQDTDEDGLSDYEEVCLGTDPLNPKSDGNTLDSERLFEQTLSEENINLDDSEEDVLMPSLSCEMQGYIDEYVSIDAASLDVYLDNRSVVGVPIEIVNQVENCDSQTLSFDVNKLIENGAYDAESMKDLIICRLEGYEPVVLEENTGEDDLEDEYVDVEEEYIVDEDGGLLYIEPEEEMVAEVEKTDYQYQPIVTTFSEETGTLSANITEDGIYMIVDATQLLQGVGIGLSELVETKQDTVSGQADIVFVIDSTGSMGNVIDNTAKNIGEFVALLGDKYNIQANFALIEYRDIEEDGNDSTSLHKNGVSNWFMDADDFSEVIKSLKAAGGGDLPESLVDALGLATTLDYRESADKFIIIVTDADSKNDNNYGYESLEEVVQELNGQEIVTSIITYNNLQEHYACVTENCNGVFGNISQNFSGQLESLVSMIGTESGDGYWYLLDNHEYVKLSAEYDKLGDMDSDGDGLTDVVELGEKKVVDFSPFALTLQRQGGSLQIPSNPDGTAAGCSVTMYSFRSDPTLGDTDYDGIKDGSDDLPLINTQYGRYCHKNAQIHTGISDTIKAETKSEYDISYAFNYKWFFGNNKKYHAALCKTSSYFAGLAYLKNSNEEYSVADDYYCMRYPNMNANWLITDVLKRHGFGSIKAYSMGSDTHRTKCYFGICTVSYKGRTKNVVAVIVKGTNGTAAEWSSNFNMGMGIEDTIDDNDDWNNKDNHKGFDIAANRVYEKLQQYIKDYGNKKVTTAYWVTGHSRGAAISNILSAYLVDDNEEVFAYTFATPNTTTNSNRDNDKYDCIFNTVNNRDFVTTVPCVTWEFGRYGKTAEKTMSSKMKKKWNKRMPVSYNQMSKQHLDGLVNALSNIIEKRDDIYKFDAKSVETYRWNTVYNADGTIRRKFMPITMLAELRNVKGFKLFSTKTKKKVDVSQSPMFFMQLVAATMPGDNENKENKMGATTFLKYSIASRYEKAKKELISSNVFRGISHAHYIDTYVIISEDVKKSDYRKDN